MNESTDSRGLGWVLGAALLAMAGSGCATISAVAGSNYANSMTAAEAAMRGDDASAAINAYQRAAETAPEQPLPWLHIAEIHAGLGDWPQAIGAAREVLHRDPDDAVAQDLYLRGSIQLADDALQYLPPKEAADDAKAREGAGDLLAGLIKVLGDEAIPADVRVRLKSEVPTRSRRSSSRDASGRSPQKTPERLTGDPLDVLGDG